MNKLYTTKTNASYNIENLNDLPKYKIFMEALKMKPNYTEIGNMILEQLKHITIQQVK